MERWADIPGYESRYQASTLGRVRSLDRDVQYITHTNTLGVYRAAYIRRYKGKVLKPTPAPSGHLHVELQGATASVHRLVAETFHGPCPEGEQCLHINETPDDNRATNLKWGTQSENTQMAYTSGALRSRQRPVEGRKVKGGASVKFSSMREAARKVAGYSEAAYSIRYCCQGKNKTAYGYTWSYV